MTILTELSATASAGILAEPRGISQSVHNETKPGFFRVVTLGSQGLFVRRGDAVVAIPLDELLKIAAAADPRLKPPAKAAVTE
jgi:hypothetical protein